MLTGRHGYDLVMSTEKTLAAGDTVTWNSQGHTIHGHVVKRIERKGRIKGHHVAASADAPEYLVKSDKTGQTAAHHAAALRKAQKKRAASKRS